MLRWEGGEELFRGVGFGFFGVAIWEGGGLCFCVVDGHFDGGECDGRDLKLMGGVLPLA